MPPVRDGRAGGPAAGPGGPGAPEVSYDRPWAALPPEFAPLLRAEHRRLTAEIVAEVRRRIPEFARPLHGSFGTGIQLGVRQALDRFADLIAGDDAPDEEGTRVFRALGRGELREGRSLDALQAAYRLGARLAWRRYSVVAERAGMSPALRAVLAEALFAHIDGIACASVEGYAEAQADAAGARQRRRHRLLELLAEGAAPPLVREAARAAEWRWPQEVSAVVLGPPADPWAPRTSAAAPDWPAGVLWDFERPDAFALVPEPRDPGRAALLRAVLAGRTAVVGPAVAPERAAHSLRWARLLLDRLLPDPAQQRAPRAVFCDDRLDTLLLLVDEELVRLLAERRLAPLEALTEKQRRRIEETLLARLETNGSGPEIAARLGIHPQTVRQRMRRVEELFGQALVDPGVRFQLEVALRGRMLAERGPAERGPAGPGPAGRVPARRDLTGHDLTGRVPG
ncbi:helix-turn-helix domain-containing protein [Streptacidiphilus sp. ASG 303]|uniref:helix-turn-helix domain-containing protein n=1 Tax=Streptacidiphilus sp. ASG 303 TaxID=2896847 RepID=UPI001E54D6A1|nr:helix-turn-helix domain-containing protein [Streptacidiphilus sp. ASG 303]MCD0484697.1 helix-turn-helix domain-containing protein [Streptacidiphilus sp. ASG 303]